MKYKFLCVFVAFYILANNKIMLAGAPDARAEFATDTAFKLANVFQSNMVLQQQKPFRIWGKASPLATVKIKADWTSKSITATADNEGNWRGEFPIPKALAGDFTPHTLTVEDAGTDISLNNLLIGEVWLASGQSNMQFALKGDPGKNNGALTYEQDVPAANFPNIRFFYTDLNFKAKPFDQVKGKWTACTPETAGKFSAVAYYFSKELYQHLNIPIGVILSTIGASTGQAWTSREKMEADTVLYNKYVKKYDESPKSKLPVNAGFSFEKVTLPTLLYNAMIHPLAGFSIRGFIWYQGEFNRSDRELYTRLQTAMIDGWRSDFNEGALPFYLVQMPPYYWENQNPVADDYAYFREAQANIRKTVKNAEMAVTIDDNEATNLHPRNKKPVGLRLSNIALNKDYKFKDIAYRGPQFSKMRVSGNTVKISFSKTSVDGGLATEDNQPPKEFYLAGTDQVFYDAKATIDGDKVILTSDKVANPVAVRYAFRNISVTNLTNKAGLPAEPFRTDDWPQDPNMKVIKVDLKKLNETSGQAIK